MEIVINRMGILSYCFITPQEKRLMPAYTLATKSAILHTYTPINNFNHTAPCRTFNWPLSFQNTNFSGSEFNHCLCDCLNLVRSIQVVLEATNQVVEKIIIIINNEQALQSQPQGSGKLPCTALQWTGLFAIVTLLFLYFPFFVLHISNSPFLHLHFYLIKICIIFFLKSTLFPQSAVLLRNTSIKRSEVFL